MALGTAKLDYFCLPFQPGAFFSTLQNGVFKSDLVLPWQWKDSTLITSYQEKYVRWLMSQRWLINPFRNFCSSRCSNNNKKKRRAFCLASHFKVCRRTSGSNQKKFLANRKVSRRNMSNISWSWIKKGCLSQPVSSLLKLKSCELLFSVFQWRRWSLVNLRFRSE